MQERDGSDEYSAGIGYSEPSALGEGGVSVPGQRVRQRAIAIAVLLSQALVVALVYRDSLQPVFVSDAWVYLARLRAGVWALLTAPTGYHYQPVACAWIAVVKSVFGESATAFQAVNMAQLTLLAFSTYELGRRLLGNASAAFLASFLVIGSASFYEAAYWPLAGNMHVLAAQFYVLAVILAHDTARGRFGGQGPWLVALAVLAAVFSHPAMITAVAVCGWVFVVVDGATAPPGGWRGRTVRMLIALAAVGGVFALARVAFSAHLGGAPRPSLDPMRAYWLVSRGLIAPFSLRGSEDALHTLATLGSDVPVPGRWIWAYVGGWLLVALCVGAAGMARARQPGLRALTGLLGTHVLLVAIAAPMSSRQGHVPAVAAALLTMWALHELAARLASVVRAQAGRQALRLLPATATVLLILGARRDHVVAAEVHGRAAGLARVLVEHVRMLAPSGERPVNFVLVNMPGDLHDRGIRAATFANGLKELVQLTAPGAATVELWRVPIDGAPADLPSDSVPVELDRLRRRALDPTSRVIVYARDHGLRVLSAEHVERLSPDESRDLVRGALDAHP